MATPLKWRGLQLTLKQEKDLLRKINLSWCGYSPNSSWEAFVRAPRLIQAKGDTRQEALDQLAQALDVEYLRCQEFLKRYPDYDRKQYEISRWELLTEPDEPKPSPWYHFWEWFKG